MSKLDREKEKIGILKFWLGIVVATFLAVAGYCITNYAKMDLYLLIASGFLLLFLIISALIVSKKIDKKIDRLEDL
ncbi:hypothetical protein [Campylobacter helveticus]|uniref:hypothetical protein n=1 Tax=Campylobacter helveticus TaxID=28898 RepID=UPI00214A37B6|nr:hypothetical protein [Campylobacter helveticus]MCR2065224.1 hypothetical protein [Campylobacter helveticus]